eukprot:11803474-Ditylum_brightwellii.AAC.1
MTRLIKAIPTSRLNSSDGRVNQRGGRATNTRWQPLDPHMYCWSCGFRVSMQHNSHMRKEEGRAPRCGNKV